MSDKLAEPGVKEVVLNEGNMGGERFAAEGFWREAFSIREGVPPYVFRGSLIFTLIATGVFVLDKLVRPELGIDVAPYEVAGVALGLLLVLRTNAGYDRWWEGRKFWGGIVNQTRTLAITALAHGPEDTEWRERMVGLITAFAHVSRRSLRGERTLPEVAALLGDAEAEQIANAHHMPTAVSLRIATMLREVSEQCRMDRFAFLVAEQSRNQLIDHYGGCEKILKTPLPKIYAINIRQFIFLFLVTLPFGLLPKIGWLTPIAVFLVAYPILALDQIGVELQNPFSTRTMGHLLLDDICDGIEGNLKALQADRAQMDEFRGDQQRTER